MSERISGLVEGSAEARLTDPLQIPSKSRRAA